MRRRIAGKPRTSVMLGLGAIAALVLTLGVLLGGSDDGGVSRHAAGARPSTTSNPPVVATPEPVQVRRHGFKRPRRGARPAPAPAPRLGRRPARSGANKSLSARALPPPPAPGGAVSIAFTLRGGGNTSLRACGATHHYRTYASGAPVSFVGTVHPVPTGRWKVKLKIKVCDGASFRSFAKVDAQRRGSQGAFSGGFPAPPTGRYSIRAELYLSGAVVGKSEKRHLATR